jgi:hypothetical protein
VVDAAFLRRHERDALRAVARERQVPCTVIECTAGEAVLAGRIARRLADRRDPSDADTEVLALQLRVREPLQADEGDRVVFDTESPEPGLSERIDALVRHLGCTPLPRA